MSALQDALYELSATILHKMNRLPALRGSASHAQGVFHTAFHGSNRGESRRQGYVRAKMLCHVPYTLQQMTGNGRGMESESYPIG